MSEAGSSMSVAKITWNNGKTEHIEITGHDIHTSGVIILHTPEGRVIVSPYMYGIIAIREASKC